PCLPSMRNHSRSAAPTPYSDSHKRPGLQNYWCKRQRFAPQSVPEVPGDPGDLWLLWVLVVLQVPLGPEVLSLPVVLWYRRVPGARGVQGVRLLVPGFFGVRLDLGVRSHLVAP